ncbi:PKD1L3 [Branchiostoma lanceolatum]|uniref:PKD1L3 protein n=1 Tax=Branchiostoma lanceolatum TaxID=7740 RepID=A0A8K0ES59_BRALA|nr:PKD1L3 [Branchiostoma lanceolatum]
MAQREQVRMPLEALSAYPARAAASVTMVVGWLGKERQPPKAAPGVSGQPFLGTTLPTPILGKGLEKVAQTLFASTSHGQGSAPVVAYNIDIAALSETRLAEEGSLTEEGEGYTFFWKGLPEGERRLHGVGFAVRSELLRTATEDPQGISERIITWRIPQQNKRHLSIISIYAPTLAASDSDKDQFYDSLNAAVRAVPHADKLAILGDFNARVGSNRLLWQGVLGNHGVGKCNENGVRLLTFCAEHSLVITNSLFQLRTMYKTSWMHPRSKRWHLLDYVLVRQRDRKDVKITRAMRGAQGWSDHRMIRTKLGLHIRKHIRKNANPGKLNIKALEDLSTREELQRVLTSRITSEALEDTSIDTEALTDAWDSVASTLTTTARQVLGTTSKRNRDWFDEQRDDIRALLTEQHKAHATVLQNPTPVNRARLVEARSCAQRELRKMKNEWWTRLATEIQGYADKGNQQQFYSALKAAYGPRCGANFPVRSEDGETLITEISAILARWAEHYRQLLNRPSEVDDTILDNIPRLPVMESLDNLPTLEEVQASLNSLKYNKAAGPDEIPGEVLRHGGEAVTHSLHSFVVAAWNSGCVPQQWKDANLISIYKRKGDRATCSNSRGISLLSSAGKVLTRIMLLRLIKAVAEEVLPESQCGFRKDRSTTDMIFTIRQVQEKCREQHQHLYMVFVDLTKAFDTVNRPLLWEVLRRFGCPDKFLAVMKALHEGAMVRVLGGGGKSDPFEVGTGVRQGCVIAPVIFNLFIAAVMMAAKQHILPEDCISLTYRLDGNLFNLRRLKAHTRVTHEDLLEFQYADDAAIIGSSAAGLQRTLNSLDDAYTRAGLIINCGKTEAMEQSQPGTEPATFSIKGTALKNVPTFTYLGSVLNSTCDITDEVHRRIGLASTSFGRLANRVFLNKDLTTMTKVAVYSAICLSILLYASETWTLYRRHIRMLEQFHMRCLQRILGLKWWHKVPHTEVRRRASIEPIESLILQRQLRWAGHVIRMPRNRLPRHILYGELSAGNRNAGGQQKRYKDNLKANLKKCNIKPQSLEKLAEQRSRWREACAAGITSFTANFDRQCEERRAKRHQPPSHTGGVDHVPFINDTNASDDTVRWGDVSKALELGYDGENFTLNYTIKIFTSTCLFFDNDQQLWNSDGCEVGPLTTTSLTHCLCNHLTAFGTDFQFFVAPNSLNILSALQGFTNIMENPSVVITIGVLFGLYLLIVVWARWEDKKDGLKVGATVLEGSSRGGQTYEVMVYTGTRANAGTSAEVFLVLKGEKGQSGPHVLEDKARITFKQGAVDTFVVTSPVPLGPIYAIHIWHNNIGPYPSWYLDQVIVTDLQEDAKHTFLCKSWLAVEEGDGKVDRVLHEATYDDLIRFGRLFSTKTSKDFRDDHLWFSVIGRPATSPFTRVQRVSCCLSLLMCTMLANIMFFGGGESIQKPPPVYILGFEVQFPISWGEIIIGIQSALMVIPVNLLIVQIFRSCAARPSRKISTVDMRNVPRGSPDGRSSSVMSFSREDPSFDRKSLVYQVEPQAEGEGTSSPTESGETLQTVVYLGEIESMEDDVSSKEQNHDATGWFLVLGTCSVSAFFTMLYGFEYGREKAEAWVFTFLTSLIFDLAISQPIKILLIGFLFALIIKKPDSLEDDVPPPQLHEDGVFVGLQDKDAKHVPGKKTPKPTGPPGKEWLVVAREQRFIELGLREACHDFVFYTSYIILLLIIANGSRDSYMYHMSTHLHNTVVNPFSKVYDSTTFWEFIREHVVSDVHDVRWYNEERFNRRGFLTDTSSYLVGRPRLRQIRVQINESCAVPSPLWRMIIDCDKPYSLFSTDVNSYDVGWTHQGVTFETTSWENISHHQRPWVYQYASLSAALPDSGEHGTYYGGGYMVELSNSSAADMDMIDELQDMNWIDDNTRAVFIELIVYNANANLFAVLTLLAEFTTLGKAYTQGEIMVVRLYPYTTPWGFRSAGMSWGLSPHHSISGISRRTQNNADSGDRRYNKYKQAASWEKINTYILGWLVCVACLKLLYLCRFNKRIARGPKVTRKALRPLVAFLVVFSFMFMAFCTLGFLVLGARLSQYRTLITTMQTLFSVMLGKMDYYSVESAGGILGPLMLFCYLMFFTNILVMMFLAIFDDAFKEIIEEEQIKGKSENQKITEYAIYLFRKFVLKNTNEEFFNNNFDKKIVEKIPGATGKPSTIPEICINGEPLVESLSVAMKREEKETEESTRSISAASSVSTLYC